MRKKICAQLSIKGEFVPEYIQGRISGIIHGVIGEVDRIAHAVEQEDGFTRFRFRCTKKQFNLIHDMVTANYSTLYEITSVML